MEKMFTKLSKALFIIALLAVGFTANAQTTPADTSWKPTRRVWGYAFGDFYFAPHTDGGLGTRGAETNYAGVPKYRNAFQFRRVYLGYDYDITKKFSAELLLEAAPNASTGVNGQTNISNGDNLVDGKMSFYIKNINLRWKGVWTGTDFVIGEMSTPAFSLLSEKVWSYRSIEKTVADLHKTNSYDVGAALQGVFDPKTKNFGYDFMIGNNTGASLLSAANANSGFFKAFYGDVYAKFLNQKLIFDVYADYMQTSYTSVGTTPIIGQQARNMIKGFVAYTTPKFTVGVEAYTQKIKNGVTSTSADGTTKTPTDATVQALSVFVRGAIVKDKLGFFARYDGYNPDNDFNSANTYAVNTNFSSYNPYQKEKFYTAGLDFTPTKNVHFMPNVWLVDYKDQRTPTTTGYLANDHTLIYRLTFYFIFGK